MPRPVPTTQTGSLADNQHGTNDTLILGAGTGPFDLQLVLHGDAFAMYDDARGGNDTLIGANGAFFNFFLADASDMYGNTHGGNDLLIGGTDTSNQMFGDTFNMHDNARGGNDTLI